jgi:hypothetical protein
MHYLLGRDRVYDIDSWKKPPGPSTRRSRSAQEIPHLTFLVAR